MLLLKIEGEKEAVNEAVEVAKSYGFLIAHRNVAEEGIYQIYMNLGSFGVEVGLIGRKDFATDDFRKELVELSKKHKNLYVAITDKKQAENKPAVVRFNGTDFDIEIELKEGVIFSQEARLSVKATLINKSEKEVVLEDINREFLFSLSLRDVADNELLSLAGNKLEAPVDLILKPGEKYTENLTFTITVDTPMCAKLVFQTVTFKYKGNPTFYTMAPIFATFK